MGKLRPESGGRRLDIKGEKKKPVGERLWHANNSLFSEPVMSRLSQKLSERKMCKTQNPWLFSVSLL